MGTQTQAPDLLTWICYQLQQAWQAQHGPVAARTTTSVYNTTVCYLGTYLGMFLLLLLPTTT